MYLTLAHFEDFRASLMKFRGHLQEHTFPYLKILMKITAGFPKGMSVLVDWC